MGGEFLSLDPLSLLLAKKKTLTESNLKLIKCFKEKWGGSTYDAIVESHLMMERELADFLAESHRVTRSYAISKAMIHDGAFDVITFDQAQEMSLFPLGKPEDKEEFVVVIGDPTDETVLKFLNENLSAFQYAVSEKKTIRDAILKYFPITSQLPNLKESGHG